MNHTQFIERVADLVEANRGRCFWFMHPEFRPTTVESAIRALNYLLRYGDRDVFREAVILKQWLSRDFSTKSVR